MTGPTAGGDVAAGGRVRVFVGNTCPSLTFGSGKSDFRRHRVPFGSYRPLNGVVVVFAALSLVIPVVLWLWMAWKCKAGRRWA
jgi:hypothetical protein